MRVQVSKTLLTNVIGLTAFVMEIVVISGHAGLYFLPVLVIAITLLAAFGPLAVWAVVKDGRAAWPIALVATPLLALNGVLLLFVSQVGDACSHGTCF